MYIKYKKNLQVPNPNLKNSNCSYNSIVTNQDIKETDDDITITTDNTRKSKINIDIEYGISDTGATGHFLIPGAPVSKIRLTVRKINITLPDGDLISSTHDCEINIPSLPIKSISRHIVPGLAHTSLISTKVLCDAGCEVRYNNENCASLL